MVSIPTWIKYSYMQRKYVSVSVFIKDKPEKNLFPLCSLLYFRFDSLSVFYWILQVKPCGRAGQGVTCVQLHSHVSPQCRGVRETEKKTAQRCFSYTHVSLWGSWWYLPPELWKTAGRWEAGGGRGSRQWSCSVAGEKTFWRQSMWLKKTLKKNAIKRWNSRGIIGEQRKTVLKETEGLSNN